jgi:hypothetical protein
VITGSNILTVPIGSDFTGFTSAVVGMLVAVIEQAVPATGNRGVLETNRANGTITGVLDATRVTMSVNASATIHYDPNSHAFPNGARAIWASDDTVAAQALIEQCKHPPPRRPGPSPAFSGALSVPPRRSCSTTATVRDWWVRAGSRSRMAAGAAR